MSTRKKSKSKGKRKAKAPALSTLKARKPAAEKPAREKKPKRVSALDAAAMVLEKVGKPMSCGELIQAMAEQGLWSSPGGKTPASTLFSAISREISKAADGGVSRFRKADRGQFAFNKA